ncbi:alpha/beta hydrolase [Ligilactobacillus equi]|uniref:Esterase n=1 Tax=Ligilactobacillus equi DSM 15833 = JCM 10991 TaxID=1423740 RepID=A0A0R1TPQ8_9LACO|nr:alpha/beta hydrolase [Ligilactobacillus equi]KRL83264.1 esterase [Ligilactobacillus equi DSM 15833 = JCM 10991]
MVKMITDFEKFAAKLLNSDGEHKLKATGKEMYGLYKPDVVYETIDGVERTLQMVVPETKEDNQQKYPLLLWVQGSAWFKQDNYKRITVMSRLAQAGFVTGILQYRESSIAEFPAPVQDTKAGLRYLRAHAEEFKIDTNNVFILGDSSGGNTALLTAFTQDDGRLDSDLYRDYSAQVNAVVAFNPVINICIPEDFPTTPNAGQPDSPEGQEIGHLNTLENPEISAKVNVDTYVTADAQLPPTLVMHGTADTTVSCRQSILLYQKMLQMDKEIEFYLIEGAEHGDVAYYTDENLARVLEFIKKHIK